MTAIAGFNCSDGVVLASDTEESYGQDKVYTHKLFPFVRRNCRFAIAGAGLGYLIDYAKEKIAEKIDGGEVTSATDFRIALQMILDSLYKQEFKSYPVSDPAELRIQLLVAVQFSAGHPEDNPQIWLEPKLFECQSNLVTVVKKHHAHVFGTGELLKELAAQLANWGLTSELAEWASIYVIHDAKRRYGGVGGHTHTFRMMDDGTYKDRPGADVHLKEEVFETFSKIVQLLLFSLCPVVPEDRAKDFLDAAKKWLTGARLDLKEMEVARKKARHTQIKIDSREMQKMVRKLNNPTKVRLSASQKSEPET